MKNSVVFIGIALVSLVDVCNAYGSVDQNQDSSPIVFEAIDSVKTSKVEKTSEELIAEDNAITGNDFSNETRALDFNLINSNSNLSAVNHKPLFSKRQKS